MLFRILFLLLLFGFGCNKSETLPPANTPRVMGELKTRAFVVSYQDYANPYSEQSVAEHMEKLNQFIIRNSTGLAWVSFDIISLMLPGTSDDYSKELYWINGYPRQDHNTRLQQDCLNSFAQSRYNFYILPPAPMLGFGFSDGHAYLSAAEPIETLPLAHEFGHMLSLPHRSSGVMIGPPTIPDSVTNDQAAKEQRNWNGWYDQKSLEYLGWIR